MYVMMHIMFIIVKIILIINNTIIFDYDLDNYEILHNVALLIILE